jgi:predicted dehydrogenase
MPPSIGFAIVGGGHVSRYHHAAVRALAHRGARLVAVATRDPANDSPIRSRFGVPAMAFAEICDHPEVDAVAICTPSGDHAAKAVAAARAGKHLVVEKPMAVSVTDADQMVAVCDAERRLLAVAFQRRTQPLFRRLKDLVAEGRVGDPLMASLVLPYQRTRDYFEAAPWRGTWALDGGGVLINQGIHLIDILVWLWGDPVAVQAMTATRHQQIEAEDTAAVLLGFSSGALAAITATTAVTPGFAHRLELYGTRGGVRIEGDTVVDCRLADGDGVTLFSGGEDPASPWNGGSRAAGHIALYDNFIDALRRGAPLVCDGRQGRRSLAVLQQVYAAARKGTDAPWS